MLVTQIKRDGIIQIEPKGSLSVNDFNAVAAEIDAMDDREETLKGVLIRFETFPGYEHLSDISAHARFVNEYGKHVPKVAICSDSAVTAAVTAKVRIRRKPFRNNTRVAVIRISRFTVTPLAFVRFEIVIVTVAIWSCPAHRNRTETSRVFAGERSQAEHHQSPDKNQHHSIQHVALLVVFASVKPERRIFAINSEQFGFGGMYSSVRART